MWIQGRETIRRQKDKEKEDRQFAIFIGVLILAAIILFAIFGLGALIIILIIIGVFTSGNRWQSKYYYFE